MVKLQGAGTYCGGLAHVQLVVQLVVPVVYAKKLYTDSCVNKLCAWRHNMPAPLLHRRAPPSGRNIAVLSHAEYVPTLTAAAALRVKAALSKAAW